jgi:hypothetical protein
MLDLPDSCAIMVPKEEQMSPREESQKQGLTVVATTSGMLRAEVLKSKLENAGIPAMLEYEPAGPVLGITVPGLSLSQVRILVADQDAADAHRILDTPPPPGWEEEALESES